MAKPQVKWRVVEKHRNIHEFRLLEPLRKGREAWLLWMSDEHWDHPKCRLDILKAHHQEAAERGALVSKIGDTFCAMQGQWDKRADKSSLRPEHQHGDYLDRLVKTACEWYSPWKANIALFGLGNHETAIYKHHETCLIERLVERMRDRGGIAHKGGYNGWVRVMLKRHTQALSRRIFYTHGSGGGGPVTKGAIDYNRLAEYVDADDYLAGHVHWKNLTPVRRVSLNDASQQITSNRHYVRLGPYKDEYEDGHSGFHVEKGRGPRPLGGWWQKFYIKSDNVVVKWEEAEA